ncbi:hypothetical protein FRC09_020186, partial [Ceratobasidium sp. 395]
MQTARSAKHDCTRVLGSNEECAFRLSSVIGAIAEAERIVIICGDGVYSDVAGFSGLDERVQLQHGEYDDQTTLREAIDECAPSNPNARNISESQLAAFNKAMARRREDVKDVTLGAFHSWLQRSFSQGRVALCLTANLDGLESQEDAAHDSRVKHMCGDNRILRCCNGNCPTLDTRAVPEVNKRLLEGRNIACPSCTIAGTTRSKRTASTGSAIPRFLRPAVDNIQIDDRLLGRGSWRVDVLAAAESCELLLVVGVSLKHPDIYSLIYELSGRIHDRHGAVVCIDPQPIRGRNTHQVVDFHLRLNIESVFTRLLSTIED